LNNTFIQNDNYNNEILTNIIFKYANNDSKKIKYEDIEKFVYNKSKAGDLIFPYYIKNISDKKSKHNAKQNFKRSCKGYDYDFKLNRFTKTINISNKKISQFIRLTIYNKKDHKLITKKNKLNLIVDALYLLIKYNKNYFNKIIVFNIYLKELNYY